MCTTSSTPRISFMASFVRETKVTTMLEDQNITLISVLLCNVIVLFGPWMFANIENIFLYISIK